MGRQLSLDLRVVGRLGLGPLKRAGHVGHVAVVLGAQAGAEILQAGDHVPIFLAADPRSSVFLKALALLAVAHGADLEFGLAAGGVAGGHGGSCRNHGCGADHQTGKALHTVPLLHWQTGAKGI